MKLRCSFLSISFSFVLLVLTLTLTGCSSVSKGMKPSLDWSRGISVADSALGTIGFSVENSGERLHFTWPYEAGGEQRIRYLQIDSEINVIVDRELDLPEGHLRTPRLLPAAHGNLHLFWISRLSSKNHWELWYVLLDQEGNLLRDASRLSVEGERVGSYSSTPDNKGGVYVVWDGGDMGGVNGIHFASDGEMDYGPQLIAPHGEMPDVRVDRNGGLHLIWLEEGQILYVYQADGRLPAAQGTPVAEVRASTSDSLTNPVLGLSDGWGYVFWSILSRAGLEAGTARVEYVAFPLDSPAMSTPFRIPIMPLEEQFYQSYQGDFSLTQLVSPTSVQFSSDYTFQPAAIHGQRDQLAVALAVVQEFRLDHYPQMALAVFETGQFNGYTIASKTTSLSEDPLVIADDSGNLHLAWNDGSFGQYVYYAATAPKAREVLDRLTFDDIANVLLQGGMESLVGMMFFPIIGVGWLLPGMVLMILWKLFRDHESLDEAISWVVLIIAIIIYMGTKCIIFPSIATYVPFSAWLDVPDGWHTSLRIGVPLLILGAGVLVAEWVRRKRSSSSFAYYLALGIMDAILTLAVYGVVLLGVH